MKSEKFSISQRIKSFQYAFNGLKLLFLEEHNSRIHLFSTFFVVLFGFLLDISNLEWIALVFAIGFVISTEIINTSIEKIADFISPGIDGRIETIKDLSAAAVLVSAIMAIVVGLIVFLPKMLLFIS